MVSDYPTATLIGQDGPVIEHAERPLVSYIVLAESDGVTVKDNRGPPGQRLSYQRHMRRAEHRFWSQGTG